MDALATLTLQIEWGADEALAEHPFDRRFRPQSPPVSPGAEPPAGQPPARAPQALAQALAADAMDVVALRAAVAAFDGCALRTTATNLVFAEGDPAAPVMLIADVPGAAEDRAGAPFAGTAGAFLDRLLASIGFDRGCIYTTSLVPWRPPGDRKPNEAEIQLCLPFVWRHLALARPRRLVLVGALAARALLPPTTGRRQGGVWHALAIPGRDGPMPTLVWPSLAAIKGNPLTKREVWGDLLRLRRALDQATTHG